MEELSILYHLHQDENSFCNELEFVDLAQVTLSTKKVGGSLNLTDFYPEEDFNYRFLSERAKAELKYVKFKVKRVDRSMNWTLNRHSKLKIVVTVQVVTENKTLMSTVLATHQIGEQEFTQLVTKFNKGLNYFVRGVIVLVIILTMTSQVMTKIRHRVVLFGEDLIDNPNEAEIID